MSLQNDLENEWDRQLEIDLATGKLDLLIDRAEEMIKTNQVKDLNEILSND